MKRRTALRAGLASCLAGFGAARPAAAADDDDGGAAFPGATWATADAAAAGWNAGALAAADDTARSLRSDAYLVVHRGAVVHAFGDTARPANVYSVRKSVLGLLIGIEVDRGRIDLDATLGALGVTDRQGLSEVERTATVRQLLQSRSGVYHPAAYETPQAAAARPPRGSHRPGEHWYYNNWDFNALATVYRQRTGRTVFEALREELALPLQFEDFGDPAAQTEFVFERASDHPAYVMRLSARDLARVGLLTARGGRWRERRIVSEAWLAQSTTAWSTVDRGTGYGYLWWVGLDGRHFGQRFPGRVFSAQGNHGQYVLVDPTRDLVVVHRAGGGRWLPSSVDGGQFARLLARLIEAAPDRPAAR